MKVQAIEDRALRFHIGYDLIDEDGKRTDAVFSSKFNLAPGERPSAISPDKTLIAFHRYMQGSIGLAPDRYRITAIWRTYADAFSETQRQDYPAVGGPNPVFENRTVSKKPKRYGLPAVKNAPWIEEWLAKQK